MAVAVKDHFGAPVARALNAVAPALAVARRIAVARARLARHPHGPPLVLISVYRRRWASTIAGMLRQVPEGADIRLWALDEVDPALEDATVGVGGGEKWELVNRLLDTRPLPEGAWVVVADDDVVFSAGDMGSFLRLSEKAGFDLAQPAHSLMSIHSHQFNVGRPLVRAGRVGFVEIGPIFAVAPGARHRFLPFPGDIGMGWGLEVLWSRQRREGAHLGVVDACRMVHCGAVGVAYDRNAAEAALAPLLAEGGASAIYDLMSRHGRWWRWQSVPPWG
jgi:hypothetical protein